MLSLSVPLLALSSLACASVIRRQDPPFQSIPATAKAPGTFAAKPVPQLNAEPPVTAQIPPAVYGARSVDIPFYRLFHGNMNFFSTGELNTPTARMDAWGSERDNANQSACGIPDNAFSISKVAIHPYFLKYAGLDRYCMQDVCISFWKEDGRSDMMLKVTDICSTDPNDPTHCASPTDIKIDRSKANIMEGLTTDVKNPSVQGDQFPEKIWWFFVKCWADGLAQPAYQKNGNWFTEPELPNNLDWAQATSMQQYKNNQVAYAAKGWETYPNGGYNTDRVNNSPPIKDWVPGKEPDWTPVAGGKGWGKPKHDAPPPYPQPTSVAAPPYPQPTSVAAPSPPPMSTSVAAPSPPKPTSVVAPAPASTSELPSLCSPKSVPKTAIAPPPMSVPIPATEKFDGTIHSSHTEPYTGTAQVYTSKSHAHPTASSKHCSGTKYVTVTPTAWATHHTTHHSYNHTSHHSSHHSSYHSSNHTLHASTIRSTAAVITASGSSHTRAGMGHGPYTRTYY